MGEGTPEPEIKPIEPAPVEEAPPLPKKLVEQPKPKVKKVAKAKPVAKPAAAATATELPPKTEPSSVPENMNPAIEDSDAVAVAPVAEEQPEQEEPVFVPVKEKVAAQPADAEPVEPVEKPEGGDTAGELRAARGSTPAEAVNYLQLKQFSGNKPPEYPLSARKDQRQGEVGLLYRVTKEGRVAEIQVAKSSGHADLDAAAVKAVSKFKFVPGQEGWAKHPVIFKLAGVATTLPSKLRSGKSAATE
jgi:protein TonB